MGDVVYYGFYLGDVVIVMDDVGYFGLVYCIDYGGWGVGVFECVVDVGDVVDGGVEVVEFDGDYDVE